MIDSWIINFKMIQVVIKKSRWAGQDHPELIWYSMVDKLSENRVQSLAQSCLKSQHQKRDEPGTIMHETTRVLTKWAWHTYA